MSIPIQNTTMKTGPRSRHLLAAAVAAAACVTRVAALEIPYPNKGADGEFAPTGATHVVDLSMATTGRWDDPTPDHDHGIYDPVQWAVVFKFSSLRIPAGTTVTFKNHPSRAPVVWLVDGDATIEGSVNLDGAWGDTDFNRLALSEPGPGGFRGGDNWFTGGGNAAGLGPGGGYGINHQRWTHGSSHASPGWGTPGPVYGNQQILPLIGGSGSGPEYFQDSPQRSGSGGGGALLLAASGAVQLDGKITANGGPGAAGGTGGAIRIIAESLRGSGMLQAEGFGGGGLGRIRIEANSTPGSLVILPFSIPVPPHSPVRLWPDLDAPIARIISVAGVETPLDPRAEIQVGLVDGNRASDVTLPPASSSKLVTIETLNLATNSVVRLRVVSPITAGDVRIDAELAQIDPDNPKRLLWTKTIEMPPGWHILQVRAEGP